MISFQHVSYQQRSTSILESVNVTLKEGHFYYVYGESGAGKSTFLRLMHGVYTPTKGTITLNGTPLSHIPTHQLRRQVSMIFQDYRLLSQKTVEENISLAGRIIGKSQHETHRLTQKWMERLGLKGKESRFPHELSGGEQQRVAIARSLISEPVVLLADEPTGNLDWQTSERVMDVLHDIQNETGVTIVMVTHSKELLKAYPHTILHVQNKKVMIRE